MFTLLDKIGDETKHEEASIWNEFESCMKFVDSRRELEDLVSKASLSETFCSQILRVKFLPAVFK